MKEKLEGIFAFSDFASGKIAGFFGNLEADMLWGDGSNWRRRLASIAKADRYIIKSCTPSFYNLEGTTVGTTAQRIIRTEEASALARNDRVLRRHDVAILAVDTQRYFIRGWK